MDKAKLKELFQAWYNQTATNEQVKELMQLVAEADNQQLEDLIVQSGNDLSSLNHTLDKETSGNMLRSILNHDQETVYGSDDSDTNTKIAPVARINWWRGLAAACVLMVLGLGGFFMMNNNSGQKQKIEARQTAQPILAPASSKAKITLANGQELLLDNLPIGTHNLPDGVQIKKLANGQLQYTNTAIQNTSGDAKMVWNTLYNPRGSKVIDLILADGSKVWLNAGSSLNFPNHFTSHERMVHITGEVYFEIETDKSKPFKVNCDQVTIEVLGTHFNINAYADEPVNKTTLLEGSIRITKGSNTSILKPGDQARATENDLEILHNVNVSETIAWKNGFFEFNNTGIESLLRAAARWYDIEVAYKETIPADRFTGKIPRTVSLTQFLKVLEFSDINFKMENRKLIVMP